MLLISRKDTSLVVASSFCQIIQQLSRWLPFASYGTQMALVKFSILRLHHSATSVQHIDTNRHQLGTYTSKILLEWLRNSSENIQVERKLVVISSSWAWSLLIYGLWNITNARRPGDWLETPNNDVQSLQSCCLSFIRKDVFFYPNRLTFWQCGCSRQQERADMYPPQPHLRRKRQMCPIISLAPE